MDNNIETLCIEKERQLLDRYFGNLVKEAACERPETVGEYTRDLPLRIETEYRDYLAGLWAQHSDAPFELEEQRLRTLMTEADREAIDTAHEDAERITLWERITKSNHEDVTYYKGLLHRYTRNLLTVMRLDFLEELTGRPIASKSFDD